MLLSGRVESQEIRHYFMEKKKNKNVMPVTSTLLCGSWDCKVEYQSDNWEGYIVILLLQGLVKI